MMCFCYFIFFSISVFFNLCCAKIEFPNFVILLADDLGIGDVGCFGNTSIRTPNIDALAASGAILSHHLAAASVCTPSRAALLTGRYPLRMGMESSGRNKVFFFVAASGGLPRSEVTIAKSLKEKGYETAIIGKWHLGNDCRKKGDLKHHPLRHGFDRFYGLPLSNFKDLGDDGQSVITAYEPNFYKYYTSALIASLSALWVLYTDHKKLFLFCTVVAFILPTLFLAFLLNLKTFNGVLMRDDKVVEQPVRLNGLTQRLVQEAKEFIQMSTTKRVPFFLYLPFVHVHTALFTSRNRSRIRSPHGAYGNNVEELDWAVGEVIHYLKKLGVLSKTFIYFSSDNGGHIEERGRKGRREGGYNGVYRGGKTIAGYEGGIRVPTIISWPGKVIPGTHIEALTSQMDLFVTISEIVGQELPKHRIYDGKSMLPLLKGLSTDSEHRILFHYCGRRIHAATYITHEGKQVWKVHWKTPRFKPGTTSECGYVCHCFGNFVARHEPPLLYNLLNDPSELHPVNVSSYRLFLNIVANATKLRNEHKLTMTDPVDQFDLINSVWKPWLQPCCNFPYCVCSEYKYETYT